jgi:trk system potassium uptake protein TrkA
MPKGQVLATTSVLGGRGVFAEVLVGDGARVSGKPLRDVQFPRGALVCAGFVPGGGAFIPHGETRLEPGTRVVAFCRPAVLPAVQRLFEPRWLKL